MGGLPLILFSWVFRGVGRGLFGYRIVEGYQFDGSLELEVAVDEKASLSYD